MKAITISKSRQIAAALIAGTLAFATMVPSSAFAITADGAKNQDISHDRTSDNVGNTQYLLQISEDGDGTPGSGGLNNMSIDVPIEVTLALKADGSFVTPTALKNVIENKSEFPVNVTKMALTGKDPFTAQAATGFSDLTANNIFSGTIASVALTSDGTGIDNTLQSIGFKKLDAFSRNAAWGMAASDNTARSGKDCLFIQLDGKIGNVSGQYFTDPINVFDITYTFEATGKYATTSDYTDYTKNITD